MLLGAGLAGAGCGGSYIPNTDVPETDENRNIVAFCELYRQALESQDVTTLVSLAASDYYENGGDVDASNDIDYAGLKDYLQAKFGEATGIRHEIRYRNVDVRDDVIYVYYTYSGSFRRPTFEGEKWERVVAENRLEIVPEGETFKIVAGM
ncbi:MAG: hypothetical protein IT373_06175 [Polyangiaceae bacterium]|nr:hypothetical protein [Polyangiaceae bacterium]